MSPFPIRTYAFPAQNITAQAGDVNLLRRAAKDGVVTNDAAGHATLLYWRMQEGATAHGEAVPPEVRDWFIGYYADDLNAAVEYIGQGTMDGWTDMLDAGQRLQQAVLDGNQQQADAVYQELLAYWPDVTTYLAAAPAVDTV